jgi:dolichol kinase
MKADRVVTGYPVKVLSAIQGQPKTRVSISKNDVFREIIHASGVAVPIVASLIGLYPVAYFILLVTAFYIISELMIMERGSLPIISSITRHATTPEEQSEFRAAPIFYAFGILFALLLFPRPASYAAVVIFVLGDSAASLFGKMFGRNAITFNKGKTVEGSFVGFAFAFCGAAFFVNPFLAASGATVAMLVEALPLPINDNLVLPLVTGALLTLML